MYSSYDTFLDRVSDKAGLKTVCNLKRSKKVAAIFFFGSAESIIWGILKISSI